VEQNVNIKLTQILAEQRETFEDLLNLCQSPIEKILLLEFIKQHVIDSAGYIGTDCLVWFDHHLGIGIREYRKVILRRLEIQYEVKEGNPFDGNINYRLDFALFCERNWGEGEIKIAIECDGHNFHEKTKEQAQRDKARDRYLQSKGWVVARYTGSEIVNNPKAIVDELDRLAYLKDEEYYLAAHPELNETYIVD
jgi:very-short-patch-repair endonuclease